MSFRNTLDYSSERDRRPYLIAAVASFTLATMSLAAFVRSFVIGDYICLGSSYYLSFARGNCRVVNSSWIFVPPYPVVGYPWVTYPLDRVGEYYEGSHATYVPLWLLFVIFGLLGWWCIRQSKRWLGQGRPNS